MIFGPNDMGVWFQPIKLDLEYMTIRFPIAIIGVDYKKKKGAVTAVLA